ncbi:IS701 family transposase [Paenibacillus herberti]|uniref:IS701 family transposase n=1 Tax=Paenibacillus herberti TaxID=1619309 RepID=A0A229P2K6_9BACL|nr:IS701 family transposase [Paenibacillus herberti]OXM16400.1 IS701 family transposase [Paenibacillus herberti]OXM16493.1 IS701 family transposase [Paenibacillus herberti]
MSHTVIVPDHSALRNYLLQQRLPLYYSKPVVAHIETYMAAATAKGFRGKVVDLAEYSNCHRTTLGHFLAEGKWDETVLQNKVKNESLRRVVQIANQTAEPLFVIHDDTISKKTKPSSQAQSPIEQTGFHHSHLEGKIVWGHQVQATVVQSSDTSLIHSIDLYDKTKTNPDGTPYTKIDHVCEMAATLPLPPHGGYVLVDSWFTGTRVIDSYASAGYHLIGGLKTNRIIYPQGIRISVQDFAAHIRKEDVRLVTVNGTSYWTYRYEGTLNDIENAAVLLCWPEQAFGVPKALRAFLCTDVSLDAETISTYYSKRWPIEIFFRQSKNNLGFDTYQVRSATAFIRLWALLAWTHLYCTTGLERPCPFGDGLRTVRKQVQLDRLQFVYDCGQNGIPFDVVRKQFKLA